MKTPKLDYRRLADHLVDRGLIDAETIRHILFQCAETGGLLPEVLVQEDLISDWEVSRVCCELFHLPYLPVDSYPPSHEAWQELDPDYLRLNGLVPLDRFGTLLTVAMPGLVQTAVLEGMLSDSIKHIMPVVGSVQSNRDWLNAHIQSQEEREAATLEEFTAAITHSEASWANIFDAGDDAVKLDLKESQGSPEAEEELLADLGGAGSADLGDLSELDEAV